MIPMFDAKRQLTVFEGRIENAVMAVVRKGWYVLGDSLKSFEKKFSKKFGYAHAIGVASGTDALKLAIKAANIEAGKKIIIPVNTAIPTAMAVVDAGYMPAFCDVDQKSLLMTEDTLEKVLGNETGGIIPVHLYGRPCKMDPIVRMAEKIGAPVIEDCAQAHGACDKGKPVGSFGLMGAYSFYPSKNLGALGDGGMVVTNDHESAGKIELLRNYGQTDKYNCEVTGCNSRLDEIQAAVLSVKLNRLDEQNLRRREIAEMYLEILGSLDLELPELTDGHVFHLFVIQTEKRDGLKEYLLKNRIASEVHYPTPLHLQKAFLGQGYKKGDFPVAESAAKKVLSIPIFPELTDQEVEKVAGAVVAFFRGN